MTASSRWPEIIAVTSRLATRDGTATALIVRRTAYKFANAKSVPRTHAPPCKIAVSITCSQNSAGTPIAENQA